MSRVSDARVQLDAWEAKKPGNYTSQYKDKIDGVMGKLDGMKDFSYDPTRDAAYEQYKNSYTRQAKLEPYPPEMALALAWAFSLASFACRV